MEEETVKLVGLLAGALTTVAFIPQAWKIWRTKSAKDLSLGTFLIFFAGITLWLAYGLLINNLPIIATNTVTIFIATAIIVMKKKYG